MSQRSYLQQIKNKSAIILALSQRIILLLGMILVTVIVSGWSTPPGPPCYVVPCWQFTASPLCCTHGPCKNYTIIIEMYGVGTSLPPQAAFWDDLCRPIVVCWPTTTKISGRYDAIITFRCTTDNRLISRGLVPLIWRCGKLPNSTYATMPLYVKC